MTEKAQTPKLDVKTLKYVLTLVTIDYDTYNQLYNEFAKSDEKKSKHFYYKKCAMDSTISLINYLIEKQQEAA